MLSSDVGHIESLRQWVESETGMDLAGTRFSRLKDAVEAVLQRPLAHNDIPRLLAQPDGRTRFLERVTGRLTVGESYFFRNEHHFRALREHVLPQILRENEERREIRIWSAGCSTGEEPYSVAILLDQLLGRASSWRVSILGTDLNPSFLERARAAKYREWSFRQTEIHKNPGYFQRQGDTYCLVPEVRSRVRFTYLNLVKDVYPSPLTGTVGLDLILFRNVAIYLKPEITAAIIGRFRQALRPGGWLLLGETEVNLAPAEGLEPRFLDRATFHQAMAERKPSPEKSASPLLPALAAAFPVPPITVQESSPLPEWLPESSVLRQQMGGRSGTLGRVAEADAGRRRRVGTAAPCSDHCEEGDSKVWEQIQRCLSRREFAGAQRAIAGITDATLRAAIRLRYTRELWAAAEIDRARSMLDVCLTENPLLIEAQLLKASLAEEAGDLAAAERYYRQALYLDRKCPIAHFHLALVQQQNGHASAAARSLRTTLKLTEGNDPHALVEHGEGVCYGRLKELVLLLTENQA